MNIKKLITLSTLLISLNIFSQTKINFNSRNPKEVSNIGIRINNSKLLKIGDSIYVHSKKEVIDTLYYFSDEKAKEFQKFPCKVPEKGKINLYQNDCCSGLIILSNNKRVRDLGKVRFVNKSNKSKIVELGWTSDLVEVGKEIIIQDRNNSPMHSDLCSIKVSDFINSESKNSKTLKETFYDFKNKEYESLKCEIINTKEIEYIFLDIQELEIVISDEKIEIKNVR